MSIVVPSYQHGRFVGEAIESALAQTHRDVEVIVVDDGSTDVTARVLERYPVRTISQPHSGICAAANRGLTAARGSYLMRLDADDVLLPTYVEETVAALAAHSDAAFAYTDVAYFGDRAGTYRAAEFDPERLAEANFVHASALMRREAFQRTGGYQRDLTDSRCEDWDLWLSFADRWMKGVRVAKPLLRYRQHRAARRNAIASPASLLRLLSMTARLQDHHPATFAPSRLLGRILSLPRRLAAREVTPRHAILLTAFYGVMLARAPFARSVQPSDGGSP